MSELEQKCRSWIGGCGSEDPTSKGKPSCQKYLTAVIAQPLQFIPGPLASPPTQESCLFSYVWVLPHLSCSTGAGTGLPYWGALLASGSPSTYLVQRLTGRKNTCFLMMLSPVKQDGVRAEGTTTRLDSYGKHEATMTAEQPQEEEGGAARNLMNLRWPPHWTPLCPIRSTVGK